jgi:hypothetical protein
MPPDVIVSLIILSWDNFHLNINCLKNLVVDLKEGLIKTKNPNEDIKAECTIMIKDDDFISLASGSGNPQQVFNNVIIL